MPDGEFVDRADVEGIVEIVEAPEYDTAVDGDIVVEVVPVIVGMADDVNVDWVVIVC